MLNIKAEIQILGDFSNLEAYLCDGLRSFLYFTLGEDDEWGSNKGMPNEVSGKGDIKHIIAQGWYQLYEIKQTK